MYAYLKKWKLRNRENESKKKVRVKEREKYNVFERECVWDGGGVVHWWSDSLECHSKIIDLLAQSTLAPQGQSWGQKGKNRSTTKM